MARTIASSRRPERVKTRNGPRSSPRMTAPEPRSAEPRETDDIIGSYDSDNDRRGEDNPGGENPGGDGDLWRRWR
eukprot:scaffold1751_cov69-Cylindrotheca_fusiformis.AAC.1